ncbi:lipopolysaccharide biosynthesis protein [Streptococcus ferus]|uniref:lipopolysaccharide biosynthesis protein n=1 Tax=Streptococcus ferus TaxID=1345 RepID=UPI0035A0CCD9
MIKSASDRSIFIWNMLGSVSTAAVSVLLLLVVSRFLTKLEADIFSFAYSIGNLMVVVGMFQVRNYQGTDIKEKYSFVTYFNARIISSLIMVTATIFYILLHHFTLYKGLVIFYICLYRLTDAVSDLFQGLYQQKQRLDIAGKYLFYRNVLVFASFLVCIVVLKDLVLSIAIVCLMSSGFILLYDFKTSFNFLSWEFRELFQWKLFEKSIQLLKETFPLFLNGFLLIYIYNNPKYSLNTIFEQGNLAEGMQTDFNILFMPAFIMNLLVLFFRPYITEMAIAFFDKRISDFKRLEKSIIVFLTLVSVVIILLSAFLGIPFLNILFGSQLNQYWDVFMILMVGGSIGSLAMAFDNILTVLRSQNLLIIPYLCGFISSIIVTNTLVSKFLLLGASISFLIAMTVWLASSFILYIFVKKRVLSYE